MMVGKKLPQAPRIMLTGANGQVGWELTRSLLPLGDIVALTRKECDLSRPETLSAIVQEIKPDVIVNAAAYTAVDKAEEEEELANIINGTSVGVMAEEAKKRNALFIHYSTDYVFDGTKPEPYTEEDTPNPINAYGRSKLAGEEAVRKWGGKYLIFRTSWVYTTRGHNFIKTILCLAQEREELKIIADQIGIPTSAEFIADITALSLYFFAKNRIDSEWRSDTYHLTPTGYTSWYGFARYVLCEVQNNGIILRTTLKNVHPINTTDFPTIAKRPLNSRLDTHKLAKAFGVQIPHWQTYVQRVIEELVQQKSLLNVKSYSCKKGATSKD